MSLGLNNFDKALNCLPTILSKKVLSNNSKQASELVQIEKRISELPGTDWFNSYLNGLPIPPEHRLHRSLELDREVEPTLLQPRGSLQPPFHTLAQGGLSLRQLKLFKGLWVVPKHAAVIALVVLDTVALE